MMSDGPVFQFPHQKLTAMVELDRRFAFDDYQLYLFAKSPDEKSYTVVKQMVMEEVGMGTAAKRDLAPVSLSFEGCIRLMDSLWSAGIRPSNDTADNTAAIVREGMKQHILDLRAEVAFLRSVVANRLGVEDQAP